MNLSLRHHHLAAHQGFTLLEVLLVLMLIALVSGGFMMTLSGAGPEKQQMREALRFQMAMNVAVDRAMLTGEELGLIVTDTGYRFIRWSTDGEKSEWLEVDNVKALQPHEIEEFYSLELTLDGLPWEEESLFDDDDSLFEDLFEEDEEKERLLPQVFIYSHGEFTDFSLEIQFDEEFDQDPVEPLFVLGQTYELKIVYEDELE